MQGESLRWIIPVLLGWALLIFTFILFPRILKRFLPENVKSLPPIQKFLLGLSIILVVISLIFALCFILAVYIL